MVCIASNYFLMNETCGQFIVFGDFDYGTIARPRCCQELMNQSRIFRTTRNQMHIRQPALWFKTSVLCTTIVSLREWFGFEPFVHSICYHSNKVFLGLYREIFLRKSSLLVTRWRHWSLPCRHEKIKSTFFGIFKHFINKWTKLLKDFPFEWALLIHR